VTTYKKRIRLWGKRPHAGADTRRGELSWHNWCERGGWRVPHIAACLVPTKLPTCRSRAHSKEKKHKRQQTELNSQDKCATRQKHAHSPHHTHKLNKLI